MDDTLLILITIFGISLLIAVQGYGFMMQGRALLDPEQRTKIGARFVYTGLGLVLVGALVALVTIIIMITLRNK